MQPITRFFIIKPQGLWFGLPGLVHIITMLRGTWDVTYSVLDLINWRNKLKINFSH